MSESKRRVRYTLESKLEAVRLVKEGRVTALTAKILGIPKQTPENWARLGPKGSIQGSRGQAGELRANGTGQATRRERAAEDRA